MNKVIFHNFTSDVIYPNTAFSVLESIVESKTIYWNITLDKIFNKYNAVETNDKILPFIDILCNDNLLNKFPKLGSYKEEVNKVISEFSKNNDECVLHGFSARYYQWIPAAQMIKYVKEPTVIGGFDSKDEALDVMKITNFNYAIWGEGEDILPRLISSLENKKNLSDIPNLIYRDKSELKVNKPKKSQIDFENLRVDHSSYFEAINKSSISNNSTFLTVEDSRGCKWNRCNFCYLDASKNNREKSIKATIDEIKSLSDKYKIYNFCFSSLDLIRFDLDRFEQLLDALIELNLNSSEEYTFTGEIVPKNLTARHIEKMFQANLIVQVGYEAVSDIMLKKVNKCTNLIDLIFYIKFAQKYGVKIIGANIIKDLPNETSEDIAESITNLNYLRFWLGEQDFKHKYIPLSVKEGTTFFNMVEDKDKWDKNDIYSILPKEYKTINRFNLFGFSSLTSKYRSEWENFELRSEELSNLRYYYKISSIKSGAIYREYCNDKLVNSITFNNLYADILSLANQKIRFSELYSKISKNYNISEAVLKDSILDLQNEYLVYFDKTTLVSIIDFQR